MRCLGSTLGLFALLASTAARRDERPRELPPPGKSADAALRAIRGRPGFRVEFAASESLVLDPVAFDWSADGKLGVVEMGDYPLGLDGKGKPGGRVRTNEDRDGHGPYDRALVLLDGLDFPSGHMHWRGDSPVAAAPDIARAEDRVRLDFARDDATARPSPILGVGDPAPSVRVGATGSLDIYRREKVGMLRREAGPARPDARPAGPHHGALMDSRAVEPPPVGTP